MNLNEALNKSHAVARKEWVNKAVMRIGSMLILATFDADVAPDWDNDAKLGQAITDAINADDYEVSPHSWHDIRRYRVVGQTHPEVSPEEIASRRRAREKMRELARHFPTLTAKTTPPPN